MFHFHSSILCAFLLSTATMAQEPLVILKQGRQKSFPTTVPAGNYSGITWLGQDRYAVVDDKSPQPGFHIFQIQLDTLTGKLLDVENLGFTATTGTPENLDAEAIAYLPHRQTLLIATEADNRIREYTLNGQPTGREPDMPEAFHQTETNGGLESLSYNASTRRLWTCAETTLPADGQAATASNGIQNTIRLQAFDDNLQPCGHLIYRMDAPRSRKPAALYAMGVSELCALDDGSLLVLEREFRVPSRKVGSYVVCKLYQVFPDSTISPTENLTKAGQAPDPKLSETKPKRLLSKWKTRLNLLRRNLANYEGMCLGPTLSDGSRTLILLSDSQNQYRGILKDWFKVIILNTEH